MSESPDHDLSDLPGEWSEVGVWIDAAALETELARETSDGHPLFNVRAEAVAVRRHLKDVVFWLPDDGRWAWVHLTWTVEASPQWPAVELATDWTDLIGAVNA